MKKLRLGAWICVLAILAASFGGCTPSNEDVSSESGVSSVGDVNSSVTESEDTSSATSDAVSTTQSTASAGNQQTASSTNKTSSTGKKPTQSTNNQNTSKPTEQVDYKDVKAEMYLATASPAMTGTLTVDTSKVVNASIVGGGINFAFSDYTYFDYINGTSGGRFFAQTMPFCFEIEDAEKLQWETFAKQLKFTGTQYVRLQVNYTQWEPVNDNNDPKKTDLDKGFVFSKNFDKSKAPDYTVKMMEQMYKVLDIFEEMGCYVILGNWDSHSANGYCPDGKNWLHDGASTSRSKLHVKDYDEHAETFAAIMYHLIKEKGYKCVKGFSIYNEPENFDDVDGELIKAYTKCDEHLKRLGIRDKVVIQGFDGGATWTKKYGHGTTALEKVVAACPQGMNSVSTHFYPKTVSEAINIGATVKKMVDASGGRPTFAGEMGIQLWEDNGPTFKLPLVNAMMACGMFNNGLKGYGIWDYNTCMKGKESYWNLLELNPDQAYELIPSKVNFYPSALMIKYLPSGTNIVSNTLQGCVVNGEAQVTATVGTKNGQTTILLVNQSSQAAAVSISGIDKSKKYQCHYVTEGKTDRIYPGDTYDMKLVKKVCLRPNSITVLTTYTHGTQTVR